MAELGMDQQLRAQPVPRGPALREAWDELKTRRNGLRARDAADALGVSEAELIASLIGAGATKLKSPGAGIIMDLPALGPVMALTRNDHVVHEKIGPYLNVSVEAAHGLVLGDKIDLRIFPSQWQHAFALVEDTKDGPRRSLQIFDGAGTAVHKIYQKPATDIAAFDRLIAAWTSDDQDPAIKIEPQVKRSEPVNGEVDVAALRESWLAMQDTHEFFGRLRKLKLDRLQAFKHAGDDLARRVAGESLAKVLENARDREVPIMVFVGNPGCIQIHSGPVVNLKRMGPWFNVLDPEFNLHLREDAIDSAWIVHKPTRDGDVTSLELFDKDGFNFAQMFGARKPGKPELKEWQEILAQVPTAERAAA